MGLGYPSIKEIKHIPFRMNKVTKELNEQCIVYPQAKQRRKKFPTSISKTTSLFQLVHIDIWGPFKVPIYDRKQYFVTIIDDFNRYTWICLIQ